MGVLGSACDFAKRHRYALLIAIDAALCAAIIQCVAYTEIDWTAYMQEVEGVLVRGELDYAQLRGDTGPLVYPGGFVAVYSLLYLATDRGTHVALAQWLFALLYLATLALALFLYRRAAIPFPCAVALLLSKRIHSIFVLRLFNDGVAMLLLYAAAALFVTRRWESGCWLFSAAVSVKMNVLLFAPGLLAVLVAVHPPRRVAALLARCAALQVAVGLPFLLRDWRAYVGKAFELSRVFDYAWTVNYRFLPEAMFLDPWLGRGLLALTAASWATLYLRRWRHRGYSGDDSAATTTATTRAVLMTLFESNVVGVAFARTLHYQFYVWLFHQLPFLLATSAAHLLRPLPLRAGLVAAVELAFNVFPSTVWSSALLVAALWLLAAALVFGRDPAPGERKALPATSRRVRR